MSNDIPPKRPSLLKYALYILAILFFLNSIGNILTPSVGTGSNSSVETSETLAEATQTTITYSEFVERIEQDKLTTVLISGRNLAGRDISGNVVVAISPLYNDSELVTLLKKHDVVIMSQADEEPSSGGAIFSSLLPIFLLIGFWYWMMKRQGGGAGGLGQVGKSKAKKIEGGQTGVLLRNVAGQDEAKQEVREIVDFLRSPHKFSRLGGKVPKGVLMVGPAGTGKTLLAKAIAGEASVPFYAISGSDFVEMFVGVGASRVRDLFKEARENSPSIIFIDEIDAVGRKRGGNAMGGNDEREQTLNQMLVEMDGFGTDSGVIVIAATNREDVLDTALLRPGRFDRKVHVSLPDIKGRDAILKIHLEDKRYGMDIDTNKIARGTPGMSGADLANLVNEAALIATKADKDEIEHIDMELAKDKIIMGPERKSMVMRQKDLLTTAYHEAGHAIVGLLSPEHDPVYKVSIVPRGGALGVTMFLPKEDQVSYSKQKLDSNIASLFGGRIAEEIIFGVDAITTGASNDIERATQLATNMVTKWGMSKLGPRNFSTDQGSNPFGGGGTPGNSTSDTIHGDVDKEIDKILKVNYNKAKKIIEDHKDKLELMTQAMMKYETIDEYQLAEIMFADVTLETLSPPVGWVDDEVIVEAPKPKAKKKKTTKNEAEGFSGVPKVRKKDT